MKRAFSWLVVHILLGLSLIFNQYWLIVSGAVSHVLIGLGSAFLMVGGYLFLQQLIAKMFHQTEKQTSDRHQPLWLQIMNVTLLYVMTTTLLAGSLIFMGEVAFIISITLLCLVFTLTLFFSFFFEKRF